MNEQDNKTVCGVDYRVIRHLDKGEEPSAWTNSYLAISPEGKRVIITYLDKDKILTSHHLDKEVASSSEEEEKKIIEEAMRSYERRAQQFKENAEWMIGIKHPGIGEVYETGFDKIKDEHLLIREFIAGLPLDKATLGTTPLQALPIFIQILEALHYLHSKKGVLHLNLKPNRVRVVENDDGTCTTKLTDCGFATPIEKEKRKEIMLGTPSFMAREVALRQDELIGPRSDLQSFGILMYYCITRHYPFPARKAAGRSAEKLAKLVKDENPPLPPSAMTKTSCPQELDTIIMNLLSEDPGDRVYKNCLEVIDALRQKFPEACEKKPVIEATITVTK